MRINENKSFFIGDGTTSSRASVQNGEKARNHGTIFAGKAKLPKNDRMQQKILKERAAMKKVLEQFSSDSDTDKMVNQLKDDVEGLEANLVDAGNQLNSVEARMEALEKENKDDEESFVPTSKEEQESRKQELAELKQKKEYWQKQVADMSAEKSGKSGTIEGIHTARLKADPMVATSKVADKEQKAASESLVSGLITDSLEEVKDQYEENIEKAKEQAEEREEEQEAIEATVDDMSNVQASGQDLQDQVKTMLANQRLLEEDMKGLAVDENL